MADSTIATPQPSGTSAAYGIVALDADECRAVLAEQRLCVIAITDGAEPYAIPLFYGFDGETVFLGISEGKKTRILDENPRVCVSVNDIGPGDAWRSIMVAGRAEVVTDAAERERAVQVLMSHNRRADRPQPPKDPSAPPPRRHSGGRIIKVADAEITGRGKR
jgi:nitroimidazol reductase NimA-like FMN-containing flavoprotein (pyridoxamine 5'-phosphate oxidase superfamily)